MLEVRGFRAHTVSGRVMEDRQPNVPRRRRLGAQETLRRPGAAAAPMQYGRRRKAVAGRRFRSESREFEREEQGNFARGAGNFCAVLAPFDYPTF